MYAPHSATQTSAAANKMSSSIGANLDRRELIAIDCESLKLCFLLRPTSHSGIVTVYGTIIRALFIALPSRAHRRGTGFLQQQQQLAGEAIFTYGWRRSTCNGWQLNVICYVIPYAVVVVLATVCGASNAIIMRDGTGWQYGQPLGEA